MIYSKRRSSFLFPAILFVMFTSSVFAQDINIKNNEQTKKMVFGNQKMSITLDYNGRANISLMVINGEQVLDTTEGIYSFIKTKSARYSTLHLSANPTIKVTGNNITLNGIIYGDKAVTINETWRFTLTADKIQFDVYRTMSKAIIAEQVAMPVFIFNSINTWEGAYQGYGGLAWFYLFNKKQDTYGVHTNSSQFWNSKTGKGLSVVVTAPEKEVAMNYTRTATDRLAYSIAVLPKKMLPLFDSGTQRRRYIRDTTDVWAPVTIGAGTGKQTITLTYFDFNEQYGRGKFVGINGKQASAVLNTIARIGVIDKQHFGGNSWHTPYGPICLHEQYIAQMGLAINDQTYLKGYQQCLDFYRDNAIGADGRVWPRWAYSNEDAMPGKFTDKGFYEAQWGYLLDSNPDIVTNVSELYDQTGDISWVKTQQQSCEKALDWIIKRDGNHNGLVEMMTDSMQQKRGSDWIDIIWASYENALVNAKLYHALVLWANIEKQLGNIAKEKQYNAFAKKLKSNFNKDTTEGGFWDKENKCYVHWRDKNGSIHGRNMVIPVNFMAIAYGICDDAARTKTILDTIETQMQNEHLFFWPLCMTTYAKGEGNDWQFPFPAYENGDIFLSWGALGVKAYAAYKPELAVKYVKNVLVQYAKDGLAFQRYGRVKQDGLGDDILSGNSLSIVGLYQAIYGINPLYNRFYLNPHITNDLAGTQVRYHYRNQPLVIDLAMNSYSVSNKQFKITDKSDFGFFCVKNDLAYFNGNSENVALKIATQSNLMIDIKSWNQDLYSWTQSCQDMVSKKLVYTINQLNPNRFYSISINNKLYQKIKCNGNGTLVFNYKTSKDADEIVVAGK